MFFLSGTEFLRSTMQLWRTSEDILITWVSMWLMNATVCTPVAFLTYIDSLTILIEALPACVAACNITFQWHSARSRRAEGGCKSALCSAGRLVSCDWMLPRKCWHLCQNFLLLLSLAEWLRRLFMYFKDIFSRNVSWIVDEFIRSWKGSRSWWMSPFSWCPSCIMEICEHVVFWKIKKSRSMESKLWTWDKSWSVGATLTCLMVKWQRTGIQVDVQPVEMLMNQTADDLSPTSARQPARIRSVSFREMWLMKG